MRSWPNKLLGENPTRLLIGLVAVAQPSSCTFLKASSKGLFVLQVVGAGSRTEVLVLLQCCWHLWTSSPSWRLRCWPPPSKMLLCTVFVMLQLHFSFGMSTREVDDAAVVQSSFSPQWLPGHSWMRSSFIIATTLSLANSAASQWLPGR